MNGKTGALYIVATPIGNLGDIGLRAKAVLAQVSLILAEDTRHAAKLLNHYQIKNRTRSFHEHNENEQTPGIIRLLRQGSDIALISDAGTPLISDPGYRLVQAARNNQLPVIPVPGPSAVIAALSASGLPAERFCFEGFLPARRAQRLQKLTELSTGTRTLVLFESSHRIVAALADIQSCLPANVKVTVAREMTKKFESFYHGDIETVRRQIEQGDPHQKGEFVIVLSWQLPDDPDWQKASTLVAAMVEYMPAKTVAKIVSDTFGISKNRLYRLALDLKKEKDCI